MKVGNHLKQPLFRLSSTPPPKKKKHTNTSLNEYDLLLSWFSRWNGFLNYKVKLCWGQVCTNLNRDRQLFFISVPLFDERFLRKLCKQEMGMFISLLRSSMQFSVSFTQRFSFQALRMIHIHGTVIPFSNYKVSSFILYVYDIPSEWVSVEYCVPGRLISNRFISLKTRNNLHITPCMNVTTEKGRRKLLIHTFTEDVKWRCTFYEQN